jgi:hypothetical protein
MKTIIYTFHVTEYVVELANHDHESCTVWLMSEEHANFWAGNLRRRKDLKLNSEMKLARM